MNRINVKTDKAPAAIGPYSQGVCISDFNTLFFLSGQIPINPATGELITGDPEAEAIQVMANIKAVLADRGMTVQDVVKTTIFLADMGDFGVVNKVYEAAMDGNLPARATVAVKTLPKSVSVEIEVLAAK